MRRYLLLTLLVPCLVAAPAGTPAQQRGHTSRIGFPVRDGKMVRDRAEEDERADDDSSSDDADAARTRATTSPRGYRRLPGSIARDPAAPATGDVEIDRAILDSSARHGVDPRLVYAVARQESGFRRRAISPKGACGVMRLMPATARRFGVRDAFDPSENIDAGVRYLRLLLDMFGGRVDLALAGYNAGEYRVIREGYRVPPIRETENYVRAISAHYRKLLREPDN